MLNRFTCIPNPLHPGDSIAILSPAGSVQESQLASTIELIKSQGYQPILAKHTLGICDEGYSYSGTEEERTNDLNWALNNPDIKAIWASRGGYGCQHLLQKLSLDTFIKYPKWYIGYSDNTVIQSYLLKHGFASIHGQTIKTSSFGVTEESYQDIFTILKDEKLEYQLEKHPLNKPGKAIGQLVGGNLALVSAMLSSQFSFTFRHSILFIEDIGENYYALDRMLMNLELAGVFKKIKGLIIGGMTNMGNESDNPNYESSFDEKAYEIIAHRLKKYHFPTLFGFPNGHIFNNRPLIVGKSILLEVGETVKMNYF